MNIGKTTGYLMYRKFRDKGKSHAETHNMLKHDIIQHATRQFAADDEIDQKAQYVKELYSDLPENLIEWEKKYAVELEQREAKDAIEKASRGALCTILNLDPEYSPGSD